VSEIVIRIPGEPFAQPRARAAVIAGRAVIYDPKKARNWKATAQSHMVEAWGGLAPLINQPLAGPVAIRVLAVFTCPKSDHRKREPLARRWHTKKPDADNVLKAVKDAAKGVLWLDDRQVCHEICAKHIGAQGEAPFVEIRVRTLPASPDIYAIAMAAAAVGGASPHPPAQPALFEERT
jgi:Holliday junction resolvase RusA-like endonuclease